MLTEIDGAIRELIYSGGQIDRDEVDVRFEMPTRDWISSLTRPTIGLYMFDVEENVELRSSARQTYRSDLNDNRAVLRMPPRRFDLRYLVTAPTTVVGDEHLLLWRVLATLLKHQHFPEAVLAETLRALDPPLTTKILTADGGPRPLEIWNALETPPRPALIYVVTAPLDLDQAISAPLVLTKSTRFRRMPEDGLLETGLQIGGVVRNRAGERVAGVAVAREGSAADPVITDERGEFVLGRVPAGAITLRVRGTDGVPKLVKVSVPADAYEITLD